jgi:raffinose/stachyose/melibiose transport system substrate-binding protein
MNFKSLFFCACFASHLSSGTAATVIKILHINPQAKVRDIWQQTAQAFESSHPGVKVEFDYLENEAFKAKLPTLLQSKDRPSIFTAGVAE